MLDNGEPRNKVTRETHGFLTRDGVSPAEFRRLAHEQMNAYPSVQLHTDTAERITGSDGQFHIQTARGGSFRAKKLLFAAGKKDVLPNIRGLKDVYGKSAFICPYCDGWELRDQPIAIIANGSSAFHSARTLSGWSKQIAVCTNGPSGLAPMQQHELLAHRIPVYDTAIRQIESSGGIVQRIWFDNGASIRCRGIFFAPRLVPGSPMPEALGCRLTPEGTLIVDDNGQTSVPGIFSAGDQAAETYMAVFAAAMGSLAAVSINRELLAEAWAQHSD
ncbi:NAD(P)/FAD-dependent oxidoreductase [Paenibacillus protaetiae]|uniref:NAD(P)/FAD-dependent oxidoreductase n=1 Tax=Paenibacillus protaetiae TaxID=2509456 RepID=UPI00269B9220